MSRHEHPTGEYDIVGGEDDDDRVRPRAVAITIGLLVACVVVALLLTRTGSSKGGVRAAESVATTSTAPATTTTKPVFTDQHAALLAPVLPDRGIGVIDGDRIVLIDERGSTLAEANVAGMNLNHREQPLRVSVDRGDVTIAWPPVGPPPVVADPRFPRDCNTPTGSDPLLVARCGPGQTPNRIDVLSNARVRTVIGPPPLPGATEVIGYWAYAVPSPDGKKVLAMWSGECEVPTTLILDTDTGKGRTAAGEDLSKWNRTTTSTPVGWTSDGLALFAAGPSACGEGRKDAGVFTASPTGRPKLLFRTSEQPEGFIWEREPVAAPLGKAAKDNTIPVELFNEFIERQRPAWSASAEDAAKAFLGPQSADVVTRSVQTRRSSTGDQVSVTDDQRDDSTRSVRTTITFAPGGNTRVRLVDAKVAWRCQPNRGHQDYSTAPCV